MESWKLLKNEMDQKRISVRDKEQLMQEMAEQVRSLHTMSKHESNTEQLRRDASQSETKKAKQPRLSLQQDISTGVQHRMQQSVINEELDSSKNSNSLMDGNGGNQEVTPKHLQNTEVFSQEEDKKQEN